MSDPVEEFAATVGDTDPVVVRGAGTRWQVGGSPVAEAREVQAPAGIVEYAPEEMTVTVRAGTPISELHAELGAHGQRTNLDDEAGTVGGSLAVGRDTVHRRGRGLARDVLLQARYVSAEGRVIVAGGPTVKNVTGFDLCRLLVGSLGTLGLMAEVILRTRPVPATRRWLAADGVDPHIGRGARTASAVLWDGATTWVHLEGHGVDVDADARGLDQFHEVAGPPPLPRHRWSMRPSQIGAIDPAATGPFVAEIGVGTVHASEARPRPVVDDGVRRLTEVVKQQFDPTGRLNPGRDPLAA
ncbi:MAG: FAD-binding protein [Acidimicrobiia bacterium]|nr:FAD-binding protein [Acidimicrobiia bacterium]